MRTDEHARLELLQGLVEVLGAERAETLMAYLPSTRDLATRGDLRALEARIDERFTAFEARIDERFTAFEARIDERFAAFRDYVDTRYTDLSHQIEAGDAGLSHQIEAGDAGLSHQIEAGDEATRSALRSEMNRLVTSQTRTIVFALVGAITANTSLVLLAT